MAFFDRRAVRCVAALAAILLVPAASLAQRAEKKPESNNNLAPLLTPRERGFEIPEGPVRPGEGRIAMVATADGTGVASKVVADVGSRRIVMLPDGALASVPMADATPTDKPFVAASHDAISKKLIAKTFKGFKTRKTKRYVYLYNTSEPFYKATSTILETMFPGVYTYAQRQKLPVHDPEVPLVVIMFKTEAEFLTYSGVPEGVAAYYDPLSNHVVMFEQSKLVEDSPELALKHTISTIAHEGVHQILHNIGVQQRMSRWPTWIGEGLPEYFSPTSTGERLRWKGIGKPNDMHLYDLDRWLKSRAANSKDDLVEQVVSARRLTPLGYSKAWALTSYLAEKKQEQFFAYVAEVAKMGPLEGDAAATRGRFDEDKTIDGRALFVKHFGEPADVEVEVIKYLKKLPYTDPIANQTHYVVLTTIPDPGGAVRTLAITYSPAAVKEYQEEKLAALPPAAKARVQFTVRAFPNMAAADAFADQWYKSR